MALLSTLITDEKTAIRSDDYRVLQFACLVPDEIMVQFQPSAAPTDAVYAEIIVGAVASGSMSNIREAMLVIYSTSTDYQQSETFRTRVRKVSGTTTLYVAENSQSLTTSQYVTVLNTYEVQEKLQRSLAYRDWDITFRKLLPIETALPSAVVLTNGTTSYQPPAAPIVTDDSASSISTHAWESSNSNDSFSSTSVAQPTITLQASAFRWLRYTFTDDNGNSNFRVIPVWTVPTDYADQVQLGMGSESGDFASINHDADLGWTATVTGWSGIENVRDKTLVVVACDEWYNGSRQSIRTNINFIGYLQNEDTATEADERIGHSSETRWTLESFGHQLARQNISSIRIARVTGTPTAWGEIQNPTPARMLTYHLSEGSTILHLCSLTIPSDDGDFVGDDLSLTSGKALDDSRFIGEVINAPLQFDVDGKLDLCRNLIYLDNTARDAADEVVAFLVSDMLNYSITYDYSKQTATLEMAGGAYDSTNDVYDLYKSIAPAVARLSEGDQLKISNQVLTTDASASAAKSELSERAANYFAANNPTYTLQATLKDEWHFLVPDVGVWFTFPLTETDTARGKVFSSSDRWQLIAISHTTNNLTGTRQVEATFRLETQDTGAMVYTSAIENDPDADIRYVPAVLPPYTGGDLGLTDGNWYDSQDTAPPSEPTPPGEDCELGGFRPASGNSYSTTNSALNGEVISTTVRGSGVIGQSVSSTPTVNATTDLFAGGGATGITVSEGQLVTFSATGTWTIDGFSFWDADGGGGTNPSAILPSANLNALVGKVGSGGSWFLIGKSSTVEMPASGELYMGINDINAYGDNSGSQSVTVSASDIEGDAFYYAPDGETWQAYGAGDGLLIEGSQPSSIPPFNPEHEYTVFDTVTSGPILYEFESPYSLSQMDNWSLQIITCFLGVP